MKKIIALISVLALAACGISQEDIAKQDADFAGCERIATSATHLVYKCPSNQEWIVNLKKEGREPNALFQNGKGLEGDWWNVANADKKHTLVEVVYGKYGKGCKENFHYRTVVKPINVETQEFYALIGCK